MNQPRIAIQVSIYLNESDEWHRRPLHLELLKFLREQEIAGATVLHAVAGFTGRAGVSLDSATCRSASCSAFKVFVPVAGGVVA